jgi:hypothetical protein
MYISRINGSRLEPIHFTAPSRPQSPHTVLILHLPQEKGGHDKPPLYTDTRHTKGKSRRYTIVAIEVGLVAFIVSRPTWLDACPRPPSWPLPTLKVKPQPKRKKSQLSSLNPLGAQQWKRKRDSPSSLAFLSAASRSRRRFTS